MEGLPNRLDMSYTFRKEDGSLAIVRCPACKIENYAAAVTSGRCVWCGWTEPLTEKV